MAIAVGKLSLWDTLRFFCLVSVPVTLWGLVAPNRFMVGLLARWDVGRATGHFLSTLRRKYRSSYLRLWFPGGPTLLVMDPHGMDAVLASDANAADPELKKRTLSQFIPDSLVISSGAEWRVRRDFNESVLQFGHRLHRHADAFVQIIAAEVEQLTRKPGSELCWEDFQSLAERISHQGPPRARACRAPNDLPARENGQTQQLVCSAARRRGLFRVLQAHRRLPVSRSRRGE